MTEGHAKIDEDELISLVQHKFEKAFIDTKYHENAFALETSHDTDGTAIMVNWVVDMEKGTIKPIRFVALMRVYTVDSDTFVARHRPIARTAISSPALGFGNIKALKFLQKVKSILIGKCNGDTAELTEPEREFIELT